MRSISRWATFLAASGVGVSTAALEAAAVGAPPPATSVSADGEGDQGGPPACDCEKWAKPEGEANCGLPVDTVNGGCNSVPPVFSTIECGSSICGTVASDGTAYDTDWYALTNFDLGTLLTITIRSDFPCLVGYIEWNPGHEASGNCADITGFVNPFVVSAGDCTTESVQLFLREGVHWLYVAPQTEGVIDCAAAGGNTYMMEVSCEICDACSDCNQNGQMDVIDILDGYSTDCFDQFGPPGAAGGPNWIPDECECIADWNRDGITNSTDVSDFVNTYFDDQATGAAHGDVNCSGVSNSTDVSDFINLWFAAQAGQLPFAGCTI
jgi:hypothetical protein